MAREFVYTVKIDTAAARAQAAQMRAVFERELKTIGSAADLKLINPQAIQQAKQGIQQVAQAMNQAGQSQQKAAQASAQATTQAAQAAQASAQTQASAAQTAQGAAGQSLALAQQALQLAQQALQVSQQAQQQQSRTPNQPPVADPGISGAVLGGVAAFAATKAVALLKQYVTESAQLSTQIARSEKAFVALSGSAATAESRLLAVQRASNGTTDRLAAMSIVTSIASLKLANTTKEFNELARAGRVVTLLSPQIRDFNDALAQLTLFSNSASFARADQLALNPEDVKNLVKELQAADSSLSDSQAKLQASVQLLNQKGGSLLDSLEAQASGYEKLTLAQREFSQGVASAAGPALNQIAAGAAHQINELASLFGIATSGAIQAVTESNAEAARSFAYLVHWIPIVSDLARANADAYEYVVDVQRELNKGIEDGVPGALQYRTQLEDSVRAIDEYGIAQAHLITKVRNIQSSFSAAAAEASDYARNQEAINKALNRGAELQGVLDTLNQISGATKGLDNVEIGNIEGIADWRKELSELRSEFIQTGTLTDEQQQRLDFLSRALVGVAKPTSALTEVQRQFGSSFLENNEAAAEYVQQILDLNAAYANHKIGTDAFNAGLEQVKAGLQATGAAATTDFNAALVRSTETLLQLDQLIAQGAPGLAAWRDELTQVRNDIIATGAASAEEATRIRSLAAAVDEVATSQADYGTAVEGLGNTFLSTNQRAGEIVQQINALSVAQSEGRISAEAQAAAVNQLKTELEGIALNTDSVSTGGFDQLAASIAQLDAAVAGGLPGADALLSQALALSDALSTGIVTDEQAAQLENLAFAADSAAISAQFLADTQALVGSEVAATDGIVAALVANMAGLTAAHDSGAISSEFFAGSMSILIAKLYELLTAAGATKAEVDALIGSLGALPTGVSLSSPGAQRGAALANAQVKADESRERQRVQRVQEAAARKAAAAAERGAKRAASEFEKGIKKAAQEFESALKSVPGLFGRSQVTEGQLKLAAGGVPQNFADDFLRRLEDEIKNGKDWPDVSIDKAKEALARVGIAASDNSELLFQQISDAWADQSLFSDKANLELINAEAVKASLDLQEKSKQGTQNIMDYFKDVMGIAIDAATSGGTSSGTGANGGASKKELVNADGEIVDEVALVPSEALAQQFVNGTLTISSVVLSTTAQTTLDGLLSSSAISLRVVDIALTPEALLPLQSLTAQVSTLTFSAEALAQLTAINQPQLQQGVDAVGQGTTFAFPDVGLQFVEALGSQLQAQEQKFLGQGMGIVQIMAQGMAGFDFSFLATAMISGIRSGFERDEIRAALRGVGGTAIEEIRTGLEEGADSISWAGILVDAITNSVTEEFATALVDGTVAP